MSTITIIGTGNMARAIGARAVKNGHKVEVMGRDGAKATAVAGTIGGTTGEWGAAPAGEIVILALLSDGIVPVVAQYGDALAGKVLVDISNPFNSTFDGLTHGDDQTSNAQQAAAVAPVGASVVKGFNTIFAHMLDDGRPDVFIAGDDAQAKAQVEQFIESLGLRPRDIGGLTMAHWLEGAGLITVGLANNGVGNFDFALSTTELAA